MEKHILICGERGVGKSTLIRRLLAESTLPVGGFVTRRLPQGYDTLLTGNGANLSQGQRQLLALARCFLSNADIVILDEATSDVDPETEEQISAALERLRRGRTCFLIAHRLATVRTADRILVLQDGRIAEQGTHQQLLDAGGIYRVLYDAQFS